MELKGSKTESNLKHAFAGESMARNQYTYFASVAKKAGYEQIASFFLETADNEKEHAKIIFKFLNGIGDTKANLENAAKGENYEWTTMYKNFATEAEEEGFKDIAFFFKEVAKIEREHDQRYQDLLKRLNEDSVFKEEEPVKWICRNCGHVHEGAEAPELCPVCNHPKAFFERKADNY